MAGECTDSVLDYKEGRMKKLFVSVPMKGRTEENIKKSIEKMKKIAEAYEGEELELIDTWIPDEAPECKNRGLWYLGESLKMMADADVFISAGAFSGYAGVTQELNAALAYRLKIYQIPIGVIKMAADDAVVSECLPKR